MALVSSTDNYIFIHIFKTGGNSIREFLNVNTNISSNTEIGTAHCSAPDLKKLWATNGYDAVAFDHMFKFAFVRNPFDWMLSTYLYYKHSPAGYWERVKDMTFEEFGANRCITQSEFIFDEDTGESIVDFVGRFESINSGWETICNKIDVKYSPLPFENVNPYRNERDYRKYYTDETRQIVERVFANDLINFNYSF